MDESGLREAEARVSAVDDLNLSFVAYGSESGVLGRLGSARVTIQVRRDLEPASEGDFRFVTSAFADLRRLLRAVRSVEHLNPEEIDVIEARVRDASPGPWTAFIEADGGQAGCDVIRVSERDDEPDMYLWMGSDLAPSSLFRLVAGARQDIPALLALVR